MKYICINNLSEFPEDFLFAKVDVERYLIENSEIEKRMKLDEFILSLNLQDYVYLNSNKTISFSIRKGLEDEYIFYNVLDEDKDGKFFERFKEKMSKLKYNLSSLKKIENYELMNLDFEKTDLFMIKHEFYV